MIEEIRNAADFLIEKGVTEPEIGVILGTGLGNLATRVDAEIEVPYTDIPGFPEATVEFHKGKLVYGSIEGTKVLVMQGRYHFYEGYTMQQIAFPVQVMKTIGIHTVLISNAAGCLNLEWKKGELMLIRDHINTFPGNPLIGPNDRAIGRRFPDMSEAYSTNLREKIKSIATEKRISLREGIYVAAQGPMLETPSEYRYLKRLGGDAVGMSTIPEVIAANHCGLKVLAVSVLTDECDPDDLKQVDIQEIIQIAGEGEKKLTGLFVELIKELGDE